MFIALFTAPLASAGTNKSDEFVTIPVYFITDRNVIANSSGKPEFGTNRQYETICKHDPHVGVALCVVENTKQKSISAPLATLGWTPSKSKDESLADLQVSSDKNYLVTEKAFYANLNKPYSRFVTPFEHRHYCPGCKSTITTTGAGFGAKEEVKHTCDACGSDSMFCCATKREASPTQGMEKQ